MDQNERIELSILRSLARGGFQLPVRGWTYHYEALFTKGDVMKRIEGNGTVSYQILPQGRQRVGYGTPQDYTYQR